MKLTVLGKYGPVPKPDTATSGYLLSGGNYNVVIDLGSGTLNRLQKFISISDIDFIILSHLHFDHIADIFPLSYALDILNKTVNVYLPKCELPILNVIKGLKAFNVIEVGENKSYNQNGLTLEFYEMTHPVTSMGVKITGENKTFAYTGDTTYNDNVLKLVKGADLSVVDGAFLEKDFSDKKPHMSIKQASSLSKISGNRIIVSHIWYMVDDVDAIKEIKEVSSLSTIAEELKEYEV